MRINIMQNLCCTYIFRPRIEPEERRLKRRRGLYVGLR